MSKIIKRLIQKDSWKVWILPVVFCCVLQSIVLSVFFSITTNMQDKGYTLNAAENILTLVLYSLLLITWYIIMLQHKRVRGVDVRDRIKTYWRFFAVIYLIFAIFVLYDLSKMLLVK